MSHFFTVVIVPGNTEFDQIESKVQELLSPFNENLTVEPYKVYFDAEEIQQMADFYEVSAQNLAALAKKMIDWTGQEGGVDDKGLYKITTYNPKSKWDWYTIGGRYDGRLKGEASNTDEGLYRNILLAKQLEQKLKCFAIITPDGEFHERGQMHWFGIVTDQKENDDWDEEIIKTIQKYQNDILVAVDCHI